MLVLYTAGDAIRILKKGNAIELTKKEFKNFLANKGAKLYYKYGMLVQDYYLLALIEKIADEETFI